MVSEKGWIRIMVAKDMVEGGGWLKRLSLLECKTKKPQMQYWCVVNKGNRLTLKRRKSATGAEDGVSAAILLLACIAHAP